MKKTFIAILLFLFSAPLLSFGFDNNHQNENQVAFPINDDYYVAWGNVWFDKQVSWDLIIAWGDLTISWKIDKDVLIAGWNVKIQNQIWDDIRIAWGDIRIDWPVGWDVIAFGWNIVIGKNATISWDLIVYWGKLQIDWHIIWQTHIECDSINIQWTLNKDAQIRFQKISVWNNASIKWNLTYESSIQSEKLKNIVAWNTNYKKIDAKDWNKEKIIWFLSKYIVIRILFLIIFWCLLVLLWSKIFKWAAKNLANNPWKSLLKWFLIYASIPFAILICFISVIWWPIWILLTLVYILLFLFYKLLNTVIFSTLIIQKLEEKNVLQTWKKILIIVCCGIVFWLLSGIDLIAAFFALGALITRKIEIIKKGIEE